MKRTIVAILALSPALFHAQVNSSAQPVSTPVLESSVVRPTALAALHAASTATLPVRVSSITVPQVIYQAKPDMHHIILNGNGDRAVVIAMTVDAKGKPSNLKIVKSADQFTDQGVMDAVSQYVYKPATLNGAPIAMEVTLRCVID